jgi:membrane fusion protein, multidrug efflux system
MKQSEQVPDFETAKPAIGSKQQNTPDRRRSRFASKGIVAAVAILAIGAAVYFIGIKPRIENRQQLDVAAAAANNRMVTVVNPTATSDEPKLVLPGNVEANQHTSIYARDDGYIKNWYVDIGAKVHEGQVLADIEAPQIDANVRIAQAQLELAEANLKLAKANSTRTQQLFQNHVNSQQEVDTVLATEQVEKASRDNAAASLKNAEDMQGFEQIRAPFDGTITARFIDVGSLVTSGSNVTNHILFDLAQSDPVRVFVRVPQANIGSVKPDVPATITVPEYPTETFTGRVARDAGAFDPTSRTLLLEIDVPNPDGRLFAGMYAHAQLMLPAPARVILVPDDTILIDAKGPHVVVVDSSNKIHIQDVKLGNDYGTKSEILGGLSLTDRIVQNPADDLKDGLVVGIVGK